MQLSSKTNFCPFLQLNRFNFRLKQHEKRFPEAISHKIFETDSSFHVK